MDWKPEAEAKVRGILDGWANSIPDNPFPDFGNKISLVSLAEKPSFIVELNTLYEARFKPVEHIKPYSESVTDALADVLSTTADPVAPDSVDIWSFESPLKNEFESQEADIEIPDSFQFLECSGCAGAGGVPCGVCTGGKVVRCTECQNGKKPCEKCSGRGVTPCSSCRGKGYTPDKDNKSGPDVLCVSCNGSGGSPCVTCDGTGGLPCGKCQGRGAFPCIRCKGEGTQPCQQCSGTGKTVKGLSFKIQYTNVSERSIAHDPQIPEGLLPSEFSGSEVGERIAEAQDIIVAAPDLSSHPPYVNAAVEGILKKAENAVSAQAAPARIIRQSLSVYRVPIFSIGYRFQDKMYNAWITAVDNKVVSKESPFKNFAQKETRKAADLAAQDQRSQAQEVRSQQSPTRDFLTLHQFSSVLAGLALMAFLGYSCGPTHHLFWPVFSFGAFAGIASLAAGYALVPVKNSWMTSSRMNRFLFSAAIAAGVAVPAQILFSMAQIPRLLDGREYRELMTERFDGALQPESMNPADLDFLKFMIGTYEPLGVDVSGAKNALEGAAKIEEDARRQAEARAKAQAEARGEKAAKAALIRQEIEAAQLKSQQPAPKAKKKKKPAATKTGAQFNP